jgi:type IV secretion system protein VirB10
MNTVAKWEGSALLSNTLVSGPGRYAIMDRWKLSRDHATLTITRTVQAGASESELALVYVNRERQAALAKARPAAPAPVSLRPEAPLLRSPAPAPAVPEVFVIDAGTKVPLALVNSISTKHTSPGDRVYLETAFPVSRQGRIIIPRGSYVSGTVTEVKRAGRIKGKAELFLRFDSLTLPNGITRDFRSRLDNSDSGSVDRTEGKVHGEGNKGGDARTVGETTAAGASVGAIAGSVAGRPGMGAGIGAAGGAAAGLAGVLLSRGPDLVLPRGTTLEMVLDRPLRFEARELPNR